MNPVLINGELWNIERVSPGSPFLIDRTGNQRLATTDPLDRKIYISSDLKPPLLDKVMLHEVAHAITVSHGLLDSLRNSIPDSMWIPVEEWSASLVERHAVEAAILSSKILGRPICILGFCLESN